MGNGYEQPVGTVFVGENTAGQKAYYQRTSIGVSEVKAVYAEALMGVFPIKVIEVVGNVQADDASMMQLGGVLAPMSDANFWSKAGLCSTVFELHDAFGAVSSDLTDAQKNWLVALINARLSQLEGGAK